jgi:hypothetical protein
LRVGCVEAFDSHQSRRHPELAAAALYRITLKEMTERGQRFHLVVNDFVIANIETAKTYTTTLKTSSVHRIVVLSPYSQHFVRRFLGEAKCAQVSSSLLNYLRLSVGVRHGPRMGYLLEDCFGQLTSAQLGV